MATSTIKLYHGIPISYEKNWIIDDIASYLATLTPTGIANFQYIKHQLRIAIKIDSDQWNLEPGKSFATNDKYVEIINSDDGKAVYYFIEKYEWLAEKTIKLNLIMDVLNTYKNGTDYVFDKKTKIEREHKDRFIKKEVDYSYSKFMTLTVGANKKLTGTISGTDVNLIDLEYTGSPIYTMWFNPETCEYSDISLSAPAFSGYPTFDPETGSYSFNFTITGLPTLTVGDTYTGHFTYKITGNKIFKNIDYISENIAAVKVHNVAEDKEVRYDDYDTGKNGYYLVLRKDSETGESETDLSLARYYYSDEKCEVPSDVSNVSNFLKYSDPDLLTWTVFPQFVDSVDFELAFYTEENDSKPEGKIRFGTGASEARYFILKKETNGTLTVYLKGFFWSSKGKVWNVKKIAVSNKGSGKLLTSDTEPTALTITPWIAGAKEISFKNGSFSNWIPLLKFDTLDRSLSTIYRVLRFPYPIIWQKWDDTDKAYKLIPTGAEWKILDGGLKIAGTAESSFSDSFTTSYSAANDLNGDINSSLYTDFTLARSNDYESKLYHSDYRQVKYVYDTYAKNIDLEKMDLSYWQTRPLEKWTITQKTSNGLTSALLFDFSDYQCNKATEDYPTILLVDRNLEMPLYNDSYLDYVRNGYNYDKNAKKQNQLNRWVSTGLGVLGTVAGVATGNVALAGISITSLAGTLINNVNQATQEDAALQQKLDQLQNQSGNVSNCQALELMDEYTNNRIKYITYECSDAVKSALADLFYYTGYKANYSKVPQLNTRIWFNFIQCNPVFKQHGKINDAEKAELVAKYQNGVTVFHHNDISGAETYDFNQQYENWETSLQN